MRTPRWICPQDCDLIVENLCYGEAISRFVEEAKTQNQWVGLTEKRFYGPIIQRCLERYKPAGEEEPEICGEFVGLNPSKAASNLYKLSRLSERGPYEELIRRFTTDRDAKLGINRIFFWLVNNLFLEVTRHLTEIVYLPTQKLAAELNEESEFLRKTQKYRDFRKSSIQI